jgi:hypothetical protein
MDDEPNPTQWGYYLGSIGQCAQNGYPGSCGNWSVYQPMPFTSNPFRSVPHSRLQAVP